jgi:hypothetical protein
MVCRHYTLSPNHADVSLATWTEHHFTDNTQTWQYRCSEVILGAKWGTSGYMECRMCGMLRWITVVVVGLELPLSATE